MDDDGRVLKISLSIVICHIVKYAIGIYGTDVSHSVVADVIIMYLHNGVDTNQY